MAKEDRRLSNRQTGIEIAFLLVVFIGLIGYFCVAHPWMILDADDWFYITFPRHAIPTLEEWNPARVLPEVLMPLISRLGVTFIMPFTGDFVMSLAYGYGVFLSALVICYVYLLIRFLVEKFKTSRSDALLITSIFVIFHFWAFWDSNGYRVNMFTSENVTCLFYYTVPAIINCSTVLLFEIFISRGIGAFSAKGWLGNGLLLGLVYFAVFSNLMVSYILPVWAGVRILFSVISWVRSMQNRSFVRLVDENAWPICIVLLWCISAVYEINGARASATPGNDMAKKLADSVKTLLSFLLSCKKLFLCYFIFFLILGIGVMAAKKKNILPFIGAIACIIISTVYLIALCSRVGAGYIECPNVLFGVFFYGMLLISALLAEILQELPQIKVVLPLMIAVLFFGINVSDQRFRYTNFASLSPETCLAIDNDIMEQIQYADRNGIREMELYVPVFETSNNWPLPVMHNMADPLYRFGLISEPITATVVPTEEKTREFLKP